MSTRNCGFLAEKHGSDKREILLVAVVAMVLVVWSLLS